MEFRLVYRGALASQGGGGKGGGLLKEKHRIRRQLHPQFKELWQSRWHLKRQIDHRYLKEKTEGGVEIMDYAPSGSEAQMTANKFKEGTFRFLPLITRTNGLACKLDILFLRRDDPGNLIRSGGGDLDNRVKTLFDALSVPKNGQMEGMNPEGGEDPLFCLLEDDCLITDVSITTDRLLVPQENDEHVNDVVLILSVTAKVIDANAAEFEWLSQ
jgi:hypothetical protein